MTATRARHARRGTNTDAMDPGPNGEANDNWNEAANADDDGRDCAERTRFN